MLKFIDVLLISHEHDDHHDHSVINKIRNSGGLVISLLNQGRIHTNGLSIEIHNGIHTIPTRIFEVTTVDGYKIVHTGDNETSEALPYIDKVDVLLLHAKTNESFTTYSPVGMGNCIRKLAPTITIPGHLHEFGQVADERAMDNDIRAIYKWSFHLASHPSTLQVRAWGEYLDYEK